MGRHRRQNGQAFRVSNAAIVVRALRSVSLIVVFTVGAVSLIGGDVFRPHGNPLLYAIAMSWLIAITVASFTSALFKVNPGLFRLTRWESDGEVYDRRSIRAFRWVVLRSPLGWINPNLHAGASRPEWDRLLNETNAAEGVHWLTCVLASLLGISYVVRHYAVYGYVMLLVRIPFDMYPIMLQRRIRGRVCRLLSRQARTSG